MTKISIGTNGLNNFKGTIRKATSTTKNIFQEYDRTPEDDSETREKEVEDAINKLNIVVTDVNPGDLKDITFCDYHRMLDMMEKEEEIPVCDFGVYVSCYDRNASRRTLESGGEYDIKVGDMVICIQDEDVTDKTSAQLNNFLFTLPVNKNIQFLLGRRQESLNIQNIV